MIPRYSTPEMDAVWSEPVRFGRWLEVELLATEGHAAIGVVPAEAAEICRAKRGPVLLEAMTYRYRGHSLSDPQRYRSKTEVDAWKKNDAIESFEKQLIDNGAITSDEVSGIRGGIEDNMRALTVAAATSVFPDPETIYEGLFSTSTSDDIGDELKTKDYDTSVIKDGRDAEGQLTYRNAIIEALSEEMIRDKRVVLYGEDVAEHGGAFGASNGLFASFGGERVFNSAYAGKRVPDGADTAYPSGYERGALP